MSVKSYLSHAVAKPLFAGLTAGLIDHYYMGTTDMKQNLYFGGAVGGGIFAVSFVEPLVSPLFPTRTPLGSMDKALEGRIVEIALGSGAAYAMNKYLLKNDYNSANLIARLGIVVVADIAGESVCELLLIV
jgi:hypothetical protein